MKFLSTLISSSVNLGDWEPFKLRNHDLKVSHLLFADDVLLFARADLDIVDTIYHTLDTFCKTSGMQINLEKLKLWLSPHIPDFKRTSISNSLRINITSSLGTYLGFPLKPKYSSSDFNFVIHKIRQKLQGWKMHNLSFDGRSQLISAIWIKFHAIKWEFFVCPKKFTIKLIKSIETFFGDILNQQKKLTLLVGTRLPNIREMVV